MTGKSWLGALWLTLTAALARGGEAPKPEYAIHGATDKAVAIYQPGEEMVFTLNVLEDGKPVAGKKIKWVRTGDDGQKAEGEALSTLEGVQVKTKLGVPGFVRVRAEAFGDDGKKLQGFIGGWGASQFGAVFFDGGACVAPEKLEPSPEPADFDQFWDGVRAALAAVPLKAEVKELQSQLTGHKQYAVTIACAGPRPATGYLTVPTGAKEKSLKAVLTFDGYGVHPGRGWHVPGTLHFHVNAHGMGLERSKAYYMMLGVRLHNYGFNKEENRDPKTAYFYGMACRLLRAFEYVKTRPEWNGKELESNGGSQGGTQGLWGAALVPEVTSADIWSPGFCDLGGVVAGRVGDWPAAWLDSMGNAGYYYDPVYMARRIKNARVHLIANYGDYTCPPSGVWRVYNNLATPNKSMEVKQGCTHGYQMKNFQSYVTTPQGVKDVQVKE